MYGKAAKPEGFQAEGGFEDFFGGFGFRVLSLEFRGLGFRVSVFYGGYKEVFWKRRLDCRLG